MTYLNLFKKYSVYILTAGSIAGLCWTWYARGSDSIVNKTIDKMTIADDLEAGKKRETRLNAVEVQLIRLSELPCKFDKLNLQVVDIDKKVNRIDQNVDDITKYFIDKKTASLRTIDQN